jgi:hypothetical protein
MHEPAVLLDALLHVEGAVGQVVVDARVVNAHGFYRLGDALLVVRPKSQHGLVGLEGRRKVEFGGGERACPDGGHDLRRKNTRSHGGSAAHHREPRRPASLTCLVPSPVKGDAVVWHAFTDGNSFSNTTRFASA